MKQEDLRIVQESCIKTLREFKRICDVNDLTYYLYGGSLLGSVRNKNMIPWDDDIDVVMPRKDYEKLILIANSQLSSDYELEHFSLCNKKEEINTHHIQIVDKRVNLKRCWTNNVGIIHPWVDVFPLDGFPSNKVTQKLQFLIYKIWFILTQLSWFDNTVNIKKSRNKIELSILKLIELTHIGKKWDTKRMMYILDDIATKYKIENSELICSFHGIYGKKEILPAEWFDPNSYIIFEGEEYSIPRNSDEILKHYYGANYMTPLMSSTKKEHEIELLR